MYANATIVENILGDLFFRIVDGEDGELSELSKEYALRLFKKDPNPIPGGGERYAVQMKNKVRFRLALRDVAAGMSFRQAAQASENVKEETGNNNLGGLSHGIVGDFVRIMLAVNLQVISDILDSRKNWAFSFAGDGSTCQGVSLFVIRVRLMVGPQLKNLHLILLPFYERHTAVNTNNLICTIFDALYPTCRVSFLGVSTDGENTMTGRHSGLATLLEREASNRVRRFWCAPHQIDLKVQGVTKRLMTACSTKRAMSFPCTFACSIRCKQIWAANVPRTSLGGWPWETC